MDQNLLNPVAKPKQRWVWQATKLITLVLGVVPRSSG